ncbi:MAG: nuclear transport factor 2 family protein [Thermoplasmata archaeon]
MSQTTEQNARQMIELVNSRNVEKLMEQYAEDATFQVPNLDGPIKGKDAIRAFYKGSFAAFPDWRMDVSKVIVSGGETIVINTIHGTHTGPLTGTNGASFAPTNKRFAQDLLTRVVFDNTDKVHSLRAYGNSTDLTRPLGLPA